MHVAAFSEQLVGSARVRVCACVRVYARARVCVVHTRHPMYLFSSSNLFAAAAASSGSGEPLSLSGNARRSALAQQQRVEALYAFEARDEKELSLQVCNLPTGCG